MSKIIRLAFILPFLGAILASTHSCKRQTLEDGKHIINLDSSTQVVLNIHDGFLLGISDVLIEGRSTSSPQTVLRPIIAQEYQEDRMIFPLLKLKSIKSKKGRLELVCDLMGTGNEQAFMDHFVYSLDQQKVNQSDMDPALDSLRQLVKQYNQMLKEKAMKHPRLERVLGEIQQHESRMDMADNDFDKKRHQILRDIAIERRERQINGVINRNLSTEAELQPWFATIQLYDSILNTQIDQWGNIHRDSYFLAHLQQPEQISDINYVKEIVERYKDGSKAGTFRWIFEPREQKIAGWDWKGWSHYAQASLSGGRKVNAIRFLETRELDGTADKVTLISLRYRGLGGIEQELDFSQTGNVHEAWSTTEILPTLLGQTVAVSPVIPQSESINDRGYALQHRVGSWIIYPARGAGSSFFDFQYRDDAGFMVYREKQGNFRAMGETYPGDSYISFTEEERFDYTSTFTTDALIYMVMTTSDAQPQHFWRNRWKEADQFLRDLISEELGFVQADVLPAIGMNWDFWRADRTFSCALNNLDSLVDILAEEGVKMVLNHNSGWINGNTVRLGMDGADSTLYVGGGSCNVNDWLPLPDIRDDWQRMNTRMGDHGMAYYVWISGFSHYYGQFYRDVGDTPENWALNQPLRNWKEDQIDWSMPKHNVRSESFLKHFTDRLSTTAKEQGFQGYWVDSFQNYWMSMLDYASGRGGSLQREYWEEIAEWTRNNMGWMSESISIPGMSCSIEVAGWEDQYWAFQHVSKWLRNGEHRQYTDEALDSLSFLLMANRGGLSFDILEWSYCDKYWTATDIVPNFPRYSAEYMAALPVMNRPYILPDEKGMLYLPFNTNQEAVVFAFTRIKVPDNIKATYILDNNETNELLRFHTYKLTGEGLLEAFGIVGPQTTDERMANTWKPFNYNWPEQ